MAVHHYYVYRYWRDNWLRQHVCYEIWIKAKMDRLGELLALAGSYRCKLQS
jgi:hypothetical protein